MYLIMKLFFYRDFNNKKDALMASLFLLKMVTRAGFEPTNACVKGMCVNRFTNGPFIRLSVT